MIAVVDYGRGNLRSVTHAFDAIGEDVALAHTAADLESADRIVLPGVGAFPSVMRSLDNSGLRDSLEVEVREKGKPFLGICVGMQLLADLGHEGGQTEGLGWIGGEVRKLDVGRPALRLPHVGWNETFPAEESPLFKGLGSAPVFYYVHTYAFSVRDAAACVSATCDYGERFVAALLQENVAATQFHPEKSQDIGLRFLMNWVDWNP